MKQLLISAWLSLSSVLAASAADRIFINDAAIVSPPDQAPVIDAISWLNRGLFSITSPSLLGIPLAYESQHTLFFTNTAGGVMTGDPGFRFFQNVGSRRLWMDTWTNSGPITTDHLNIFGSGLGIFSVFDSQASVLMVRSTNIASTGPLRSGAHGLIHLEGKNVNLKRNALWTGFTPQPSFFSFGSSVLSSNYVNDFGVREGWWGLGTNNTLNGQGAGMRIDNLGGTPQFRLPDPSSPTHEVVRLFGNFPFTFLERLPLPLPFGFNPSNYTAAVLTNQLPGSATNFVVQVVFYPTNYPDPNLTTEVQFLPDFVGEANNGASIPVVAFHSTDFDIVDQVFTTDSIYLSDALGVVTNAFLAVNGVGNSRRPNTYQLSHLAPANFGFFGFQTNAIFTPALLWRPSFQFNVVTNRYAAYDASIGTVASTALTNGGTLTNFPGRIQVIGEEVNLEQTRIRAESALVIKASKNLTSNQLARVDAPWVNFDATTLAPRMIISNLAPATVRRLSGDIAAWSATWKNFETNSSPTNEFFFHVLIVDARFTNVQPVVVNEFAAHAANLIICDKLNIGKSFLAEAHGLDIKGGLSLPLGASWGATNFLGVVDFTNEGIINILQLAKAGTDRPFPYDNYINRGTNTAAAHFIRTLNFENSGSIIANAGLLRLDALTASMMGPPLVIFNDPTPIVTFNPFPPFGFVTNFISITNSYGAVLEGNSDVQIFARDLVVSNSFLQAGIIQHGSLIFSVTNSLVDSGQSGINHWLGTAGFQMLTLPRTSDLLATYLTSVASGFGQDSFHTWAAEDRGPTVAGYNNNLALGKLTLNGATNSLFHFGAPSGQTGRALYVDYLELLNYATNFNLALDISPDITIYFANSNLNPLKLDNSTGGRLHWISGFTGPLSSTNITYPDGRTFTFNTALVTSRDLDSDGDGIVNADDPTPLPEPNSTGLQITMTKGYQVQLSWRAKAQSTSRVEYVSGPAANNWQVLTNIINGPTNGTLKALDSSPAAGKRFYRVRVNP